MYAIRFDDFAAVQSETHTLTNSHSQSIAKHIAFHQRSRASSRARVCMGLCIKRACEKQIEGDNEQQKHMEYGDDELTDTKRESTKSRQAAAQYFRLPVRNFWLNVCVRESCGCVSEYSECARVFVCIAT